MVDLDMLKAERVIHFEPSQKFVVDGGRVRNGIWGCAVIQVAITLQPPVKVDINARRHLKRADAYMHLGADR